MPKKVKGSPKTGGRKKGTPNIRTKEALEIAEELGIDPFRILLQFAQGDWEGLGYTSEVYHKETAEGETTMGFVIPPELRQKAAGEATKYLYPQRKAVELSGDGEKGGFAIVIQDFSKDKK
jgi:hypothetical protein